MLIVNFFRNNLNEQLFINELITSFENPERQTTLKKRNLLYFGDMIWSY